MEYYFNTNVDFTIRYNMHDFEVSVTSRNRTTFSAYKDYCGSVFLSKKMLLMRGKIEKDCVNYEKLFEYVKCGNWEVIDFQYPGDYTLAVCEDNLIYIYNSAQSTLPVFYMQNRAEIILSTIHTDLPIDVIKDIDPYILALTLNNPHYLPYKDISIVNAGQLLKITNGVLTHQNLELARVKKCENELSSLEDVSDCFIQLMNTSLVKQISQSKRVGLLLSGGIDSALLAYCLYQLDYDVVLYTWSMPSLSRCDEWEYAHLVAKTIGYPHKRIFVDSSEFKYGITEQKGYSIPLLHNYSKSWETVCEKMKADGVEVLISGYGAGIFDVDKYKLHTMLKELSVKDGFMEFVHAASNPFFSFRDLLQSTDEIDGNITSNFLRHTDYFASEFSEERKTNDYNRYIFNMQEYAQEINLFQKHRISCIHPYHFSDIYRFATSLPDICKARMHLGQIINKLVLRYSMIGKLPQCIVNRTYPASMSALTQKNVKLFCRDNDVHDALSPLIDLGIVNTNRLDMVLKNEKMLMRNAQSLHTCILFCKWIKNVQ